jgi:group I intron endonuclease
MENLLTRSRSHICSALLKHGYLNFSLTILEYCEPGKCIEREKYFIDYLQSEYNIIKNPTLPPMSGRTHSEESKTKISDANVGENNPMYGKNHNEESIQIMSDAKKGENNPRYGKPKPEGALRIKKNKRKALSSNRSY